MYERCGLDFAGQVPCGCCAAENWTGRAAAHIEQPDCDGRRGWKKWIDQQCCACDPADHRPRARSLHWAAPRTESACPAGAATSAEHAGGRSASRSGLRGGDGGG